MINDLENKLKFLIDINKKMDGICIEEIHTSDNMLFTKFEAKISSIYVIPPMWSPTEAFFDVIERASMKYFGTRDIGYNNTRTVFWIRE